MTNRSDDQQDRHPATQLDPCVDSSRAGPPSGGPGPRQTPRTGPLSVVRERLSAIVGVTAETRQESARTMLARHGRDRFGYWLQLVLAMAIATYGLVLGSTGVVIGAMLVSPLMGPLIEIGMGLVVGSPILVAHSLLRTLLSVVVVVVLSALLTVALPYHEVTPEIAARTAPTLLDLYVACFCALAAAYTTVRRGSDTVAAAAGTAISIALVPPLCVVGWGVGSHNARVWRGAALLFTANFCAIVLFSVAVFVILAFDTVDVAALEREAGQTGIDRLAARLRRVFGSKYGPALRLLMPLALVAAVFVPLRSALDEVAWSVKTRAGVQRIVERPRPTVRAVRSAIVVEQHAITIRMLVVSTSEDAAKLRRDLVEEIAGMSGVAPSVEVIAVPDADALRVATQMLTTTAPIVAPPQPDVTLVEREIREELAGRWPEPAAGKLAAWRLVVERGGRSTVEVVHFGPPLGAAGEAMLASSLGARARTDVALRDHALTESRVAVAPDRWQEWLPALHAAVGDALVARVGHVCVTSPIDSMKGRAREQALPAHEQAVQALSRLPPDRSKLSQTAEWSVALSASPCPASPAISDAGAD